MYITSFLLEGDWNEMKDVIFYAMRMADVTIRSKFTLDLKRPSDKILGDDKNSIIIILINSKSPLWRICFYSTSKKKSRVFLHSVEKKTVIYNLRTNIFKENNTDVSALPYSP